jgi:hypothetical protein
MVAMDGKCTLSILVKLLAEHTLSMDITSHRETRKHTSQSQHWLYGIAGCMLVLVGCAQLTHKEEIEQIDVSDISKAETMELAEDVLAQLHFSIDKIDVKSGFIKTRPLPGAQLFELWRGDNVGLYNSLQANLQSIRRTVELDITEQGEKTRIYCNVKVQRLSLPEREVIGSAHAYDMFSRSSPYLQKFDFNPEQEKSIAWIDLDDDIPLATEILKRIRERILDFRIEKQHMTRNET